MNHIWKFVWAVIIVGTLLLTIATLGMCGMTIVSTCSNGEPSVSIAQYEPETTPDIYDN